ncbi:uncharacterized protein UDID_06752 [Ustilago sp. UG-2017a]|nr:uncharacterized protein UDID_06752 [Ustilago sp. UG-2017a]
MKAIFSTFGRRANVDRRDEAPMTHFRSSFDSPSTRIAPTTQPSFSSLDAAGRGIGDVPTITFDRSSKTAPANGAWTTKWSASLRSPDARHQGSHHSVTEVLPASATGSSTTTPTMRSPHPPSSYREPMQPSTSSGGKTRSLVRKFSTTSRRDSSTSNDASDALSHLSTSRLRQLPAPSDLSSASIDDKVMRSPPAPIKTDLSATSSAKLASRLNELAVANADGLLSDDEYRTLRQAVFDCMLHTEKHSMAPPSPNSLPGPSMPRHVRDLDSANAYSITPSALPSSPNTLLAPAMGRSRSTLSHGERRASSIRSGQSTKSSGFQNVADMFKKGARRSKDIYSQTSQDSQSSQEHIQRDVNHRVRPIRRDSEGVSSQLSSGDGHSQRAPSFGTQWSSAAKSCRASTFGRLRAGSQARRVEAESAAREMEEAFSAERTARSLKAMSIHDAGSTYGITYDRSPTSLRAEMAPSSMYGAEYGDKSSAEIQAEMGVVQAEGDRMLATFSTLEETLLAKHAVLEPAVMKRAVERVRESHPLASVTRLEDTDASPRGQRPPPPSSYRTPRQTNGGSDGDVVTAQNVATLEAELTHIYTQKSAVVKRYQDRLAFLQSKLRSAAIREGLK